MRFKGIFRWGICLLAAVMLLTTSLGCGNNGNGEGSADLAAVQTTGAGSEADAEITAANRLVLANEAQLPLPEIAGHEGTVRYYLPFEAGKHRGVSQGIHGSTSHYGKLAYAIDWNLLGYADYRLPVVASAPGMVVLASLLERFGNCVVLRHLDGSRTRYAHLDEITVTLGQDVRQAEKIGLTGTTGHSSGPHLHFEILDGEMNGMLPVFAEGIAIPVGDAPCTTASEDSGCYESQNVLLTAPAAVGKLPPEL